MIRIYSSLVLCLTTIFTSAQDFEWAFQLGGPGRSEMHSMAKDALDNIYLVGNFNSQIDFDPDTSVYMDTANGRTVFIAKYDTSSMFLDQQIICTDNNFFVNEFKFDGAGDLIMIGSFMDSVFVKDGSGSRKLTSNSDADIFLIKYDATYNIKWAHTFGGRRWDRGLSVDIGPGDSIYITGTCLDTVDFDPSASTAFLYNATNYFAKYDKNGNFLWVKPFYGSILPICADVSSDGSIVISGGFGSTMDVDPDTGTVNLIPTGWSDLFIAKYTDQGKYLWSSHMPGSDNAYGNDVKFDANGNVFIGGVFQYTVDFDPGPDTVEQSASTLTGNGGYNIFLAKYDTLGQYQWVKNFGDNTFTDWASFIYVDKYNDVYITGEIAGYVVFNASNPSVSLNSGNDESIFFAKYKSNGDIDWAKMIDGNSLNDYSDGILIDSDDAIFISGSFYGTADFNPGSGMYNMTSVGTGLYPFDAFLAKYDQCLPSFYALDTFHICYGDTFIYHDSTIGTSTGTHVSALNSQKGCDSIIKTRLVVHTKYNTSVTAQVCKGDYYIFPNGDSSNAAMIQTSVIPSRWACDSTVITNLNIDSANNLVDQTGSSLQAQASSAFYQWINCDNNSIIPGANNRTYIATSNGSYAVIVTQNGCTDTSACLNVTSVGLLENGFGTDLSIYPNPTTGLVNIELGLRYNDVYFTIRDAKGQVISTKYYESTSSFNTYIDEGIGLYLLEIHTGEGKSAIFKILKE